jgi:hypothetical protein
MTTEDALRFLAHEAAHCRERDAHEMHVLLYPALLRLLCLAPMDSREAGAFRCEVHAELCRLREPVLTGQDFE